MGKWEDFTCSECKITRSMLKKDVKRKKTTLCRDCWRKETGRRSSAAIGEKNPAWKGGKTLHEKGYIYVTDKSKPHPYILEQRKVMEEFLGRQLTDNEIVHHIDLNKTNNNIDNLHLYDSYSAHKEVHNKLDSLGGSEALKKGEVVFDKKQGTYYEEAPF